MALKSTEKSALFGSHNNFFSFLTPFHHLMEIFELNSPKMADLKDKNPIINMP
jgi:hypothetical protein